MQTTIKALAPAKINLTLDILGTLPDGYHAVKTLMQATDLHDELTFEIEPSSTFGVTLRNTGFMPAALFPVDNTNLIYKAAKLFSESTEQTTGHSWKLSVDVHKIIPVGAGLGGGSADAAATLIALNHAAGKILDETQLLSLAGRLGADVPFCLLGGTAVGTHRGDVLQPIADIGETLSLCIIKPKKISVSTPWAYQKYDEFAGNIQRPDTEKAIQGLRQKNLDMAIASFCNVFEPVIFAQYPELQELKTQLLELECWCCHLSGSGPALFAVVADLEQAHYIRRIVLHNEDDGYEYGSGIASYEFGPPIEFHITQSAAQGARLVQ